MFRCLIYSIMILTLSSLAAVMAQTSRVRLDGRVTVQPANVGARGASVTVVELKRTVLTDEHGGFVFQGVPPGTYQVIVHLDRVADLVKTITIASANVTANFDLTLDKVTEQVTVTASGSPESTHSAYQPVTSLGAIELSQKNSISLGEALENETGVGKRGFGPASGRPVIRGFDGDRVLVLQDGLRLGSIASQSADEAEPMDLLSLDRVEIVRGPATLLYGSNAIGGVVNGVSANETYLRGLSGYATAFGGSNNRQGGESAGFKFGVKNFLIFGNQGVQNANDYSAANGPVINSYGRAVNTSGGVGWFNRKGWIDFGYSYDRRRHGIPAAADAVDFEYLKERRRSFEIKSGLRQLGGFIDGGDFAVRYNRYQVREFEFESDENKTELDSIATNKNFNYRANFNQRRQGKLSGTFGFSGFTRDFLSVGEEAPAPHTKQHSFAAYALERLDFEKVGFQFGGRIEQNGYRPEGDFRARNFLGFSGSGGMRARLWNGGTFVANYQHSFRAPALEELYNHGPHPGILTFDIGNQDLAAEQGDGIDLSLRHRTTRVRADAGVYYYNIRNFVFTAFTGQDDAASKLPIIRYEQATGRFVGAEANLEVQAIPMLWLSARVDYARAELTDQSKPLPRIPPLRGSIGLDWRYKAFGFRPQLVMARKQDRVFDHETPTAGYAVFNVSGSYTFVTRRVAHVLALNGSNLTNRLYRNHLSFIKEIAPEMGRNARLTYTLRF